ncbi:transcriptional repressor [Saccharothrix sp. NEAU-S10]|nr:transcriptional repressor [Saccharothrix luteola]
MGGEADDSVGGVRRTSQRRAVLRVLHASSGPVTAQEIHERARMAGERIGLATVYRHLDALTRAGVTCTTQNRSGTHLYHLRYDDEDDHHLTCVKCGRTVRVNASAVVRWAVRTAGVHGFSDIRLSIDLTVLCLQCGGDQVAQPEGLGRSSRNPPDRT